MSASDPPAPAPPDDDVSPLATTSVAALPPGVLLGQEESQSEAALPEEENGDQFWEAPLFASVEAITNHACASPSVSTENILSWCKPQFKGLTVYFSPAYKPSDYTSWSRLKNDLQVRT